MSEEFGRVQCGTCGKNIKFPLAKAGKVAKCPACGEPLRLVNRSAHNLGDHREREALPGGTTFDSGRSNVLAPPNHPGCSAEPVANRKALPAILAIPLAALTAMLLMCGGCFGLAFVFRESPSKGPVVAAEAPNSEPSGDVPSPSHIDSDDATSADGLNAEPPLEQPSDAMLASIGKSMQVEAVFVRPIGDIKLLVGAKQLRAYVPANYSYPLVTGTDIGFDIKFITPNGSLDSPTAGFVPVNGKPEQVKILSSDPGLIEVFDDASAGIRGSGDAIVRFECSGERIEIPIKIRTTPFAIGYSESGSKDLISVLGIPQRKQSHFVRWPQSEIIDQMYYGPRPGAHEVGEHWEYDQLPGLAIRVVGSFVKEIGMRDRPPGFVPQVIRVP